MKKNGIVVTILLLLGVLLVPWSKAAAATDGFYNLSEVAAVWDGTDASRTKAPTADYNYIYGDEASLTYTLPWSFSFYGQSYSQINIDTNGNVWFGATGSANSFNLANNGRSPVIAAWNNDLSSYYYGGVFVQHKTNPERVVIEWQTETYTDEGYSLSNDFEVVLFQSGNSRIDYKSFKTLSGKDFGSGISSNDGSNYLNVTANYGNAYTLAGHSYDFVSKALGSIAINSGTQYTNSTSVAVGLSAPDPGSVSQMCISNTADCSSWETYSTTKSWALDIGDGVKTVYAWYKNNMGYVYPAPYTASITLDQTPPAMNVSPSDGAFTNNASLSVSGTVSDNTGVQSFRINGALVGLNSSGNFSYNTQVTAGANTITMVAVDLAGNQITETRTITLDQTAPILAVSAPVANSTVNTPSMTVSGTINKIATVAVQVNGGLPQSASISGTSYEAMVNLSPGLNYLLITATDRAGNSSQVTTNVTYVPPMSVTVSPSTIPADFKGIVGVAVNNIAAQGAEVLVEQIVDVNGNGAVDSGDYVVRSFKVTDGTSSPNPNVQGDEDGAVNSAISTSLNYFMANDLYHAPGNYFFRVTNGASIALSSFVVTPVTEPQSISGAITVNSSPLPGAIVQLTDKWQRPISYALADNIGHYSIYVKGAGDYIVKPFAYGFISGPTSTPVTLTTGQAIAGYDFTLTPGVFHVTGLVKDDSTGAGIDGIWVKAVSTSGSGVAISGQNGNYDLLLPSGQYTIAAVSDPTVPNPSSKGYLGFDNMPTNVNVMADMSGNDLALPQGGVLVTGKVSTTLGYTPQGIPVQGKLPVEVDARVPGGYGVTNANGDYTLAINAGNNWNISLNDPSAQILGYLGNGIGNFSTTGNPLTGNNLTVYPITAWIQGTVKDSNNNLIAGGDIRLRNADSSIVTTTKTTSDGTYRIGALAGNWFVDDVTHNKTNQILEQGVALSDGQTAVVDFVVDVTPPTLAIDPVTTPTASTSQTITGTVDAGSTIAITIDTYATVGPVTYPTQTTWSCTVSGLALGNNNITVTATDTAGNTSTATAQISVIQW